MSNISWSVLSMVLKVGSRQASGSRMVECVSVVMWLTASPACAPAQHERGLYCRSLGLEGSASIWNLVLWNTCHFCTPSWSQKNMNQTMISQRLYFVRTNLSVLFFCTQPAFFGVTSLIKHVQSVLCPGTSWLDVRALLLPVLRIAWLGRLDPWLTLFSLEFLDRCCACVVLPRMLLLKSEAHLVSSVL